MNIKGNVYVLSESASLAWNIGVTWISSISNKRFNQIKKSVRNVPDQALQSLYIKAINAIKKNLQELVQFYPYAPGFQSQHRDDTGFYAGDLLD